MPTAARTVVVTPALLPRRLVGAEYVVATDGRRVQVVDYELVGPKGRTGRLVVTPAGNASGLPWAVWPEELEDVR